MHPSWVGGSGPDAQNWTPTPGPSGRGPAPKSLCCCPLFATTRMVRVDAPVRGGRVVVETVLLSANAHGVRFRVRRAALGERGHPDEVARRLARLGPDDAAGLL